MCLWYQSDDRVVCYVTKRCTRAMSFRYFVHRRRKRKLPMAMSITKPAVCITIYVNPGNGAQTDTRRGSAPSIRKEYGCCTSLTTDCSFIIISENLVSRKKGNTGTQDRGRTEAYTWLHGSDSHARFNSRTRCSETTIRTKNYAFDESRPTFNHRNGSPQRTHPSARRTRNHATTREPYIVYSDIALMGEIRFTSACCSGDTNPFPIDPFTWLTAVDNCGHNEEYNMRIMVH